jgi:hypothetical protein
MSDVGSSGAARTMTVFFSGNIFEMSSGRDSSSTVRKFPVKDTSICERDLSRRMESLGLPKVFFLGGSELLDLR